MKSGHLRRNIHELNYLNYILNLTNLKPGGELPYETDGDARRKIRIKPLNETNLGVAQALFEPKTRPRQNRQTNQSYSDF